MIITQIGENKYIYQKLSLSQHFAYYMVSYIYTTRLFDTLRASHDRHEANWFAYKPDLISNLYDTNQGLRGQQVKEVVSSTFFFCELAPQKNMRTMQRQRKLCSRKNEKNQEATLVCRCSVKYEGENFKNSGTKINPRI